MELSGKFDSEKTGLTWISKFRRSFASLHWALKLLYVVALAAFGFSWLAATLAFSIPFITPIWFALWWSDNPFLWELYPGLGFAMIWTTVFLGGWVHLSLYEHRTWSRLKLAILAARAILLTTAASHILFLGGILITRNYFWFGTLIFFLGGVLFVHPAAMRISGAWMWRLFPDDHPKSRNDRFGYIALAFVGGCLIFLFSLIGTHSG